MVVCLFPRSFLLCQSICNYVKDPGSFYLPVDKSDGTDSESGAQEEDVIPDEIYKSRLASIKRVCSSLCITSVSYFSLR